MATTETRGAGIRGPRGARRVGFAALAGLWLSMSACGGGGGGGFGELLFVSDGMRVTSWSVSPGGVASIKGAALVPGIPGTYDRVGNLVTVTIEKHSIPNGQWVRLDFGAGAGGTATDGDYPAVVLDPDTFTIVDPASGAITGGTLLRSPSVDLPATYVQSGTTITVTLVGHALSSSATAYLDFTSGTAVDQDAQLETVPDANTFTVEAESSLTTSGNVTVTVGQNYEIFGVAMHPNGRWLYAASIYECYNGNPYCWGSDLISRFAIDWSTGALTFEESVRTSGGDVATLDPAPVTLAFSQDGTRLVHQDDELDGLRLWDVNPVDGSLTLLASSASNTTTQHGAAFSSDGTRVYHGARVFTVGTGPDSITLLPGGSGGEANRLVNGDLLVIIGGQTNQIRAFSLANPDLPAPLAASPTTPHGALDFDVAQGGSLVVSSGWGGLKSYTWDGVATIAPAVGAGDTELRDGGLPFPVASSNTFARVYRTVSLNEAGTIAAAAYFLHDPDAGTGGIAPSGFILASVAADGTLALLSDVPIGAYSFAARFCQKP
jgi:hypothetical protein